VKSQLDKTNTSTLLQQAVKQRRMEDWLLSRICHSWLFQLRMFLLCWALNLSAWKRYGKLRQMSEGVKSIYVNSMPVSPEAEALLCCASCKMSWDPSIRLRASLQTDLSPSTLANPSSLCVSGTTNSAFGPKNGSNHCGHGSGTAPCHALRSAREGKLWLKSSEGFGRIF